LQTGPNYNMSYMTVNPLLNAQDRHVATHRAGTQMGLKFHLAAATHSQLTKE